MIVAQFVTEFTVDITNSTGTYTRGVWQNFANKLCLYSVYYSYLRPSFF